ncbi:hypothetical protein K2173_009629 [Erythroxylum novogranatense]|uniref:Uncharacterized protein n=1 Tax=Erythroxylum novogranatense TaxID=1862640 RepID=A0AAV8U8N9_9ROSI|nr:hypothetical protein K2173_009629 [Erythroxylum novogranatense]
MEAEHKLHGSFEVHLTERSIVRSVDNLSTPHILTLSNLDLLCGRFPITYFYVYHNPEHVAVPSILSSLKSSLAKTLCYYYPFAGRIVQNPSSNEPEIICDNTGALVVQGHATISLRELDFYNLNETLQDKLISLNPDFPFQVQITNYTCGGISVTFTFDHALGDASSFGKFLVSWSEIAQNKPISCMPDHRRSFHPRNPPTYHPSLDQIFVKCTIEEIINIPTTKILLKRLYHIDISNINRLQRRASTNGCKRTKIEAFSAYLWKIMANVIDEKHEKCKMGWLIDGRGRLYASQSSMSNYVGNVLSIATAEGGVTELKQSSMPDVAGKVHDAISKVTSESHFLDLIDWIECHRPGLMMSNAVLGRGGPTLVLSSGRRFPVAELDFGFGSPVLGTVYSTIQKLGVAYMNQRPSGRNDGSWTVSAILWPELATALESDSIFEPMSVTHLQL